MFCLRQHKYISIFGNESDFNPWSSWNNVKSAYKHTHENIYTRAQLRHTTIVGSKDWMNRHGYLYQRIILDFYFFVIQRNGLCYYLSKIHVLSFHKHTILNFCSKDCSRLSQLVTIQTLDCLGYVLQMLISTSRKWWTNSRFVLSSDLILKWSYFQHLCTRMEYFQCP